MKQDLPQQERSECTNRTQPTKPDRTRPTILSNPTRTHLRGSNSHSLPPVAPQGGHWGFWIPSIFLSWWVAGSRNGSPRLPAATKSCGSIRMGSGNARGVNDGLKRMDGRCGAKLLMNCWASIQKGLRRKVQVVKRIRLGKEGRKM